MTNLIFYPQDTLYNIVIEYLYDEYEDNMTNIVYSNERSMSRYEYRFRKHGDKPTIKSILPHDCDFEFTKEFTKEGCENKEESIEQISFRCQLRVLDKGELPQTYVHNLGCQGIEDRIFKKMVISSDHRDYLIKLVDMAKVYMTKKHEEHKKSSSETIRVFYFRKEYWSLLAKSPKRPIETLYLKEGEKEGLITRVEDFFKDETRDIYLSFGMPYKQIIMLYGVPGSGKTSTITAVASHFNCDIYTIPITKELTDYGLIDAFSEINDREDKQRIIVLEDIDCMFTKERKEGDEHNMITLQGLLNCLDGHTCVEGTLLFMTANNPENMDYAMVRSCRIDYKLELGYADKYQTQNIFDTFLPNQSEHFKAFYQSIKHKEVTTAMLQEFLFYNRSCDNIIDQLDQLTDIIDKNKPSGLGTGTKDKHLYM
jgi:hypothetical protein